MTALQQAESFVIWVRVSETALYSPAVSEAAKTWLRCYFLAMGDTEACAELWRSLQSDPAIFEELCDYVAERADMVTLTVEDRREIAAKAAELRRRMN